MVGKAPAGWPMTARSLTDAEQRAKDGDPISDAERSDLTRAGWTFQEWRLVDEPAPEPDTPREDGPLLAAVKADIKAIDTTGPGKKSLAELALWLAMVIDSRGLDGGASTAARLGQELRATMVALTAKATADDPNALANLLAELSKPDRGVQ